MNTMQDLQKWYLAQCNGHWEHAYGIKIETLDNPGWAVTIDLAETRWVDVVCERRLKDRGEGDWVRVEMVASQFVGHGGPTNLEDICSEFLRIINDVDFVSR